MPSSRSTEGAGRDEEAHLPGDAPEILPRLKKKVILDEKARGVLPLLQLDGKAVEAKP
jgi:hypothetical protein